MVIDPTLNRLQVMSAQFELKSWALYLILVRESCISHDMTENDI